MFGKKLQKIRKELKLSQEEMSLQTGVSYRAYTSYERGDRKPSLEFLKTLVQNFDVNLNWLVADKGDFIFNPSVKEFYKNEEYFTKKVEEILQKNGIKL